MSCFLVSYDLRKKEEVNYQLLWDEFKTLNGVKIQDSVYLVDLDNTQQEVLSHFTDFVHTDDRLLVAKLESRPGYTKALPGTNAWLNARFS